MYISTPPCANVVMRNEAAAANAVRNFMVKSYYSVYVLVKEWDRPEERCAVNSNHRTQEIALTVIALIPHGKPSQTTTHNDYGYCHASKKIEFSSPSDLKACLSRSTCRITCIRAVPGFWRWWNGPRNWVKMEKTLYRVARQRMRAQGPCK